MDWVKVQEILEFSDLEAPIVEQDLLDLSFKEYYTDTHELFYFRELSKKLEEDIGIIASQPIDGEYEVMLFPYSKTFKKLSDLKLCILIMENINEN